MYTKEDIGTEVFLPYYGDEPCKLIEYLDDVFPVKVKLPDGRTLRYGADGKANPSNHWPVLSRTPYIQGEPFVCVVERAEPDELWKHIYAAVAGGHELPDMESEQVIAITNNVHKYVYDRFCKLSDDVKNNPYPNIGESGKVRMYNEDQSRKVQEILFSLGYKWRTFGQKYLEQKFDAIAWNASGRGFLRDFNGSDDTLFNNLTRYHLYDFGPTAEVEPKPLTFADFKVDDRVSANHYGPGTIEGIERNLFLWVRFDEGSYIPFGHTSEHKVKDLTKLPTPKPFGPEDDGATVYDQEGYEWTFCSAGPEHRIAQIKTTIGRHKGSRYISVEMNTDGTTATALKFTRTKPEK